MRFKLFLILVSIFSFTYSQTVRINEVAASNSIFFDEDGDTPDWIELHNYGSNQVSLYNWKLTDTADDDTPWLFPNISIDSDEYLLIWASDKNRSDIYYARTLINQGDVFRYVIPDENTQLNWMNPEFEDSAWNIGASGFGYDDSDDNTIVTAGTSSIY